MAGAPDPDEASEPTDPGTDAGAEQAGGGPVGVAGARAPLFLHRETYKHRRVMDAARLLPLLGAALLLLPMLWETSHLTSMGAVYLFLAWLFLIVLAAVLARRLAEPLRDAGRAARDDVP
ncbi:MAG: hypothetical protein AAGB05_06925 [Pseudomonadota bacterium]